MGNKPASNWADTHTLDHAVFWWTNKTGASECTLYDKTYAESLIVAKTFGYVEPKWYRPSTWNNGVVTVD